LTFIKTFVSDCLCSLRLEMSSVWNKHYERSEWRRPCFRNQQNVIIGDSHLKAFAKHGITHPDWAVVSYSGADIVEINLVLKLGKIVYENGCPILHRTKRCSINYGKKFKIRKVCEVCNYPCSNLVRGKILLSVGYGS
jgi:hypothetical protein